MALCPWGSRTPPALRWRLHRSHVHDSCSQTRARVGIDPLPSEPLLPSSPPLRGQCSVRLLELLLLFHLLLLLRHFEGHPCLHKPQGAGGGQLVQAPPAGSEEDEGLDRRPGPQPVGDPQAVCRSPPSLPPPHRLSSLISSPGSDVCVCVTHRSSYWFRVGGVTCVTTNPPEKTDRQSDRHTDRQTERESNGLKWNGFKAVQLGIRQTDGETMNRAGGFAWSCEADPEHKYISTQGVSQGKDYRRGWGEWHFPCLHCMRLYRGRTGCQHMGTDMSFIYR